MKKTIQIVVFGERAKIIEEQLNLINDGDITDLNAKIWFEKRSVEGRLKVMITFHV